MKKKIERKKVTQIKWCERCKRWVEVEYKFKMFKCPRCHDILSYHS